MNDHALEREPNHPTPTVSAKSAFVQSILIALLGIASSIGGAWVGGNVANKSSIEQERIKSLRERRDQAFTDFANSLDKARRAAELRIAAQSASAEFSMKLTDKAVELDSDFEVLGSGAMKRIAIFGEAEVVRSIANWSRSEKPNLQDCTGEVWKTDLNSWKSMRRSALGSSDDVDQKDLGELALPSCRPKYAK
jgi:hypothetical protein